VYAEEDLVPISAIQHVMFCERQYALIHLEQLWEENRFTAEGQVLHGRVDVEHHESRRLHKTEYGMAIRSLEYGLIGKADVVEFEKNSAGGYVSIKPVEFKRGRSKEDDWDRVQLCAQALCLEEMFQTQVSGGQFYYLQEHRRTSLLFDSELRQQTLNLILRIREIIFSQQTPVAIYNAKKCDRCSLVEICMPKSLNGGGKSVSRYIRNQVKAAIADQTE
jgi:CRISPR-associated exonuclease Cas4